MSLAAPLSATAEAVLTFLESVGRRSEAELYLSLFLDLPKESFALIAPGAPVVRSALGSLVEQLKFLSDLGLFAPLLLGLFEPELGRALAERVQAALPAAGLTCSLHSFDEPDLVQVLRGELRAQCFPVLYVTGANRKPLRVARVAELMRGLETRKLVMLRRRGGLCLRGGGEGGMGNTAQEVPGVSGRLSVVNLATDRGAVLASGALSRRDAELLEMVSDLLTGVGPLQLIAAVTSPLSLLKELFTVKGAGTLIKRGTLVDRWGSFVGVERQRLRELLELSFGRELASGFFDREPLAVYLESAYRGVAVVYADTPAPYLGKFAVLPEAQGEGIGRDLWQAMVRDFPSVYWRSRADNPINSWYESVCDGMMRLSHWQVFWRGVEAAKVPEVIERALEFPADFGPPVKVAGGGRRWVYTG